ATYDLGPVLLEFEASGKKVRSRRFGHGADNLTTTVAVDAEHGVRLVAVTRGAVDFGDGDERPPNRDEAIYVARFGPDGTLRWNRKIAAFPLASVAAARVDARGDTVVIGHFFEGRAVGTGAAYAFKIDASGTVVWKRSISRGATTWLSGLAFDP